MASRLLIKGGENKIAMEGRSRVEVLPSIHEKTAATRSCKSRNAPVDEKLVYRMPTMVLFAISQREGDVFGRFVVGDGAHYQWALWPRDYPWEKPAVRCS